VESSAAAVYTVYSISVACLRSRNILCSDGISDRLIWWSSTDVHQSNHLASTTTDILALNSLYCADVRSSNYSLTHYSVTRHYGTGANSFWDVLVLVYKCLERERGRYQCRNHETWTCMYVVFVAFNINHSSILPLMALNSLYCADVPLSNYSLTHSLTFDARLYLSKEYNTFIKHSQAIALSVLMHCTYTHTFSTRAAVRGGPRTCP